MNRGKILEAWRKKRASGQRIAGGRGGPDYVFASHEDKLGMRGAGGLLPIGDANALSLQSARERVAQADGLPVLAGVCATDPLRLIDKFVQEMKEAGVSGIQNVPSVGMIDGAFRTNLEAAGLGYAKEVELMRLSADLGLLSAAWVFTPEDAKRMAEAGADVVIFHPGLDARETPKDRSKRLEAVAAAAREARKDILVFAVGAPEDSKSLDGIQSE